MTEPNSRGLPSALLLSSDRYEVARDAVDKLSDRGFDVSHTAIVWKGLRRIEHVTGRRTSATAALQGALSGAWFGLFIALLLALFVEFDGAGEVVGLVLAYVIIGAIVGAVWMALAHWATRGRRDFSTLGVVAAESYDVMVDPALLAQAQRIVAVTDTRPVDPEPVAARPDRFSSSFPPPRVPRS